MSAIVRTTADHSSDRESTLSVAQLLRFLSNTRHVNYSTAWDSSWRMLTGSRNQDTVIPNITHNRNDIQFLTRIGSHKVNHRGVYRKHSVNTGRTHITLRNVPRPMTPHPTAARLQRGVVQYEANANSVKEQVTSVMRACACEQPRRNDSLEVRRHRQHGFPPHCIIEKYCNGIMEKKFRSLHVLCRRMSCALDARATLTTSPVEDQPPTIIYINNTASTHAIQ